ncbi:MAG: type II toxin-antitoxin system HicA family toxin [Candidatus Desulfofervidus auxilii]|nr:type II toxin-antitoxin system HicA family toxin [Candidatus Desulfofervidus auxilii]
MPKLPVVSGDKLIKLLTRLGYEIVRQKGSHVRLRKKTEIGEHNITVPKHKEIAKGTLNDILSKVSLWNNISKEELVKMLSKI